MGEYTPQSLCISPRHVNDRFCRPCRAIIEGNGIQLRPLGGSDIDEEPSLRYYHHASIKGLRHCAKDHGCPICKLYASTKDCESFDQDQSLFGRVSKMKYEDQYQPFSMGIEPFSLSIDMYRVDMGHALDVHEADMVSENTFSSSCQSFIKKQLLSCEGSARHELCNAASNSKDGCFLPSRLIDTGGSSPEIVKIVSKDDAQASSYATLSHCWGGTTVCKLMTHNLVELQQTGILVSTMPLTFQHAIIVARSLSIRYLWIDSLCIVQDSADDWDIESAVMGQIYRYGRVNIAASSSANSDGGLFFERDPSLVQPFVVHHNSKETVKSQRGWFLYNNIFSRWSEIGEQPLNTRAWVVQERFLSPRTIHFTKLEVIWDCLCCMTSETSAIDLDPQRAEVNAAPIDGSDNYNHRVSIAALLRGELTPPSSNPTLTKERMYWLWRDFIIPDYTSCQLTMESDKLVAISGITGALEGSMDDECLAGLWRSRLPFFLIWHAELPELTTATTTTTAAAASNVDNQRPQEWRAPSWSWASLNSQIAYPPLSEDEPGVALTELLEADVKANPNGSVEPGARLRLRGPLVKVMVKSYAGRDPIRGPGGNLVSYLSTLCIGLAEGGVELDGQIGLSGSFFYWMDETVANFPESMRALIVWEGMDMDREFDESNVCDLYALLVVPFSSNAGEEADERKGCSSDEGHDSILTYRRIGLLKIRGRQHFMELEWERFMRHGTEEGGDRLAKWASDMRVVDLI